MKKKNLEIVLNGVFHDIEKQDGKKYDYTLIECIREVYESTFEEMLMCFEDTESKKLVNCFTGYIAWLQEKKKSREKLTVQSHIKDMIMRSWLGEYAKSGISFLDYGTNVQGVFVIDELLNN